MTGQRFGMLAVVSGPLERSRGHKAWLCRCDCGTELEVRGDALRVQQSCGCINPRGTTHGKARDKVYRVWSAMIGRCTNPNNAKYADYGARGIVVCDRWLKFENFYADMGDVPKGRSIERRNNDGNYDPSNCVWLPRGDQAKNRRGNIYLEMDGERVCLAEAARRLGVGWATLRYRIEAGKDIYAPVRQRRVLQVAV